jgi:ABC-type sugar transport system ATPase subunit
MAGLVLRNVWKKFGTVTAVRELNLEIRDREFVSFLGPSGCGKTTTLNMIAGLENVTSGEILMDGQDLTKVPPRSRNLAMVFQGYALYPHMTVADNIGFALKVRNMEKAEIVRRVADAAERLELKDMLDRYPRQLSGGQRQRVALGRAFVRDPHVFLLDEPLSNLDAVLRVQTRVELKRLFAELDTTAVYVTHDQAEAMTMSDRIAVFRSGELQQFASPLEIYRNPANRFVATFVGSPPMSVFQGMVDESGNLRLLGASIPIPEQVKARLRTGATYDIGLRPEDVTVGPAGEVSVRVDLVEHLGAMTIVHLSSPGGRLIAQSNAAEPAKAGDTIFARINPRTLYVFDAATGEALITPAGIETN